MKPDNELMNYAPHNNGSGGCMRNSAICTWLWIRRRMERAARDLSMGETNIKWSESWWNEWERKDEFSSKNCERKFVASWRTKRRPVNTSGSQWERTQQLALAKCHDRWKKFISNCFSIFPLKLWYINTDKVYKKKGHFTNRSTTPYTNMVAHLAVAHICTGTFEAKNYTDSFMNLPCGNVRRLASNDSKISQKMSTKLWYLRVLLTHGEIFQVFFKSYKKLGHFECSSTIISYKNDLQDATV